MLNIRKGRHGNAKLLDSKYPSARIKLQGFTGGFYGAGSAFPMTALVWLSNPTVGGVSGLAT